MQSFIAAFLLKGPKITDHKMVSNFLGAMENPFRSHVLWKGADESETIGVWVSGGVRAGRGCVTEDQEASVCERRGGEWGVEN